MRRLGLDNIRKFPKFSEPPEISSSESSLGSTDGISPENTIRHWKLDLFELENTKERMYELPCPLRIAYPRY